MHFLEWKYLKFNLNSQVCNWQNTSFGLDDGLAPNRWQATIWTKGDLSGRSIYVSEGLNEFTNVGQYQWCHMASQCHCEAIHMSPDQQYDCCVNDSTLNPSPPGQNGRDFAEDIFRCIFVNEKFCILIKISLKFVPKDPIGNNLALV